MRTRVPILFTALALLLGCLLPSTPAAATDPPPPTPGRTGPPSSIAVLGDSISTATGTGTLGAETSNNSWSTGTNAAVNSTYQRLLAINPAIAGNRSTMASNGRRMVHMAEQAAAMPTTTQYVEVALGGNDLCRPSVAEMTSVADYRAQFVAGLEAIAARAPEALISVYTVPDIFNLWYIRYAPASYNGLQSDQASQARTYVTLSIIPCLALLQNPASVSEADMNRRFEVRARNMAFNQVLIEECSKVLRCRHDGGATFDLSSNRGPDGEYRPRSEWVFVDTDISRNTISFCPASGAFAAGCGDHFHPSLQGQAKLAQKAWEIGRDWSDALAPEVTVTPPDGAGPVVVTATDAAGVRGIEHRVGDGPWEAVIGSTAEVDLPVGTHHLEVRALDVNGNLSDSQVVTVTRSDDDAVGDLAGVVTGASGPLEGARARLYAADSSALLGQAFTDADGGYRFEGLAPGWYKVRFSHPDHIGQFFSDKGSFHTADVVEVPADGTATASVTLRATATLGGVAGTVRGAGGAPVAAATVRVYDATAHVVATVASGPDGTYALADLAPGAYKVLVIDHSGAHVSPSWVGGASFHSATSFPVTAGQTTPGADIDLVPTQSLGKVSGTVTEGGAAATGLRVVLYDDAARQVTGVFTGEDGTFSFGALQPGTYFVRVREPASHADAWWDGRSTWRSATPIEVGPGDDITGIDLAVVPLV